jgi:hypothetical protein
MLTCIGLRVVYALTIRIADKTAAILAPHPNSSSSGGQVYQQSVGGSHCSTVGLDQGGVTPVIRAYAISCPMCSFA